MSNPFANLGSALPSSKPFVAPVESSEFESDPVSTSMLIEERRHTRLARQTVTGCAIVLLVLVLWATIAPIHEVVTGDGEILPEGLVQPVEHLEGGIVAAIHVNAGQRVSAGDALVDLDTTATQEEWIKAQARLQSLELTIAREQNLAGGDSMETAAIDSMWLRLYDSQADALSSAEQYRDAQLDVLRADKTRLEAELAGLLREQESNVNELAIVERQLTDYERAFQTGAVSRRERDAIEREAITLRREEARLASSIEALRASVAQANAREIELIARLRQEALTSVSQLEAERAEVQALVRQLEDRQARQSLIAPIDGIVHIVNVRGPGDVVSPADVVLEIVPDSNAVFAQVDVPAERVGGVQVGMEASVKVLTYDFTRFGALDAIVENVSPSSVTREDGRVVFVVDLRIINENGLARRGQGPLQPGMTVMADIVTGSKTVLQYLLKPLRVLSDRALTES